MDIQLNLFERDIQAPELNSGEGPSPKNPESSDTAKHASIADGAIETSSTSIADGAIEIPVSWLRFLRKDKSEGGQGHVNEYVSSVNRKSYYRFSYRLGNREKHHHIPGGRVGCAKVESRAAIIRDMCRNGRSTLEIIDLIRAFN
jgi:hypothetical protein